MAFGVFFGFGWNAPGTVYAVEPSVPVPAGDFTISGDDGDVPVQNTDYTYASKTLTILSDKDMTIGMATPGSVTNTHKIVVAPSASPAGVTLDGVQIDVSATANAAALHVDGATLNLTLHGDNMLKSGSDCAGLQLENRANLKITVASDGHRLTAVGIQNGAGIGSRIGKSAGDINIAAGVINAESVNTTVSGTGAAGIGSGGGGAIGNVSSVGDITITGGKITATSGRIGGGIGTANNASSVGDITITGGHIDATSGVLDGAGIGGGYAGNIVGDIHILGGVVNAISRANDGGGAGIGAGTTKNTVGNIRISGGTVNATASAIGGAGIGAGYHQSSVGDITISDGIINATGSGKSYGAGIGGGNSQCSVGAITISGGYIKAAGGSGSGAGIGGGAGSSTAKSISISGGSVDATGVGYGAAGIGGGTSSSSVGNITISGGIINATGSQTGSSGIYGAGIGGGSSNSSAGDITISGGDITATGGLIEGAGIGAGTSTSPAGDIRITGGTVVATRKAGQSQDIGYGNNTNVLGVAAGVTIDGGSVWAMNNAVAASSAAIGPKNSAGASVYANKLSFNPSVGTGTAIFGGAIDGKDCAQTPNAAAGVYGVKDVKTAVSGTNAGQVCLWLPARTSAGDSVKLGPQGYAVYGAEYEREDSTPAPQTLTVPQEVEYIVSFDLNGVAGVPAPNPQTITSGGAATAPDPSPSAIGYRFLGWLNNGESYAFNNPVTSSLRLVAAWEKIDIVPPVSTIAPAVDSWVSGGSIIGITATDADWRVPSGVGTVSAIRYSVDGGAAREYAASSAPYTTSFALAAAVPSDGPHTVSYHAIDASGNAETAKSAAYKLDTTDPRTDANRSDGEWLAPTDTVTLSAIDPGASADPATATGSGLSGTYYRFGGSGSFTPYTEPLTLGGRSKGANVFEYYSADHAGNKEETHHITLNLDSVQPVGNLTASAIANPPGTTGGAVTLWWTAPTDLGGLAVEYQVYRYEGDLNVVDSENWGEAPFATTAALTLTDSAVRKNSEYSYKVVPVTQGGPATGVVASAIKTPATKPSPARNLIHVIDMNTIHLTWDAPVDDGGMDGVSYEVAHRIKDSSWSTPVTVHTTGTSIGPLTKGFTYEVSVRAENNEGIGAETVREVPLPTTVPTAPKELTGAALGFTVSLSWQTPNDTGGEYNTGTGLSYNVYYKEKDSAGQYTSRGSIRANTNAVENLMKGRTYLFHVTASNTGRGEGSKSNEIEVYVPLTRPSAPRNVTASAMTANVGEPTSSALTLSWDGPSDTGGGNIVYDVYMATGGALTAAEVTGSGVKVVSGEAITSRNVMDLSKSAYYTFLAVAKNASYETEGEPCTVRSRGTVTTTPRDFSAVQNGPFSISLSWTKPYDTSGGESYTYTARYKRTDAGATDSESLPKTLFYDHSSNGDSEGLSFTKDDLKKGGSYEFELYTVNSYGPSVAATTSASVVTTTPGAARGLNAVPTGVRGRAMDLSWSAPEDDGGLPLTYTASYKEREDVAYIVTGTGLTRGAFTVAGLENGRTYDFKVEASNEKGAGTPVTGSAYLPLVSPTAPEDVKASKGALDGTVTLSWTRPVDTGGAANLPILYEIWLHKGVADGNSGDGWELAPSGAALTTTGATITLPDQSESMYSFTVRAYNVGTGSGDKKNDSPPSRMVFLTARPDDVTTVSAMLDDDGVSRILEATVTWPAITGIPDISYKVYYREGNFPTPPTSLANWTPVDVAPDSAIATQGGLERGNTYSFVVYVVYTDGVRSLGKVTGVHVPPIPPEPARNLSAQTTAGGLGIRASWRAPSYDGGAAAEYEIAVIDNSSGTIVSSISGIRETFHDIPGLSPGRSYTVSLKTRNSAGYAAGGAISMNYFLPALAPYPVSGLTATVVSGAAVRLDWTQPSFTGGAIVRYEVSMKTGGEIDPGVFSVLTGSALSESYTVAGLEKNRDYTFRIVAYNTAGRSAARTVYKKIPATAPTSVSAIRLTDNTLAWDAPGDAGGLPVTYEVWKYAGENTEADSIGWMRISSNNFSSTSLTTGELAKGGTYSWYVVAKNDAGDSEPVFFIHTVPETPPGAPAGIKASAGGSAILIEWDMPQDVGTGDLFSLRYTVAYTTNAAAADNPAGYTGEWTSIAAIPYPRSYYQHTGLTTNSYTYKVYASNRTHSGEAAYTSADVVLNPKEVSGFTATPSGAAMKLVWERPSNAGSVSVRYEVYRATGAGIAIESDAWITKASIDKGALDSNVVWEDNEPLRRGVAYSYKVVSIYSDGATTVVTSGDVRTGQLPFIAPGDVENLTASAIGGGSITLSWDAPAEDGGLSPVRYDVYRTATGAAATTGWALIEPGVTTKSHISTDSSKYLADSEWSFKVVAKTSEEYRAEGKTVDVKFGKTAPGAVTCLTYAINTDDKEATVTLSWTAPSYTGDSSVTVSGLLYKVERMDDQGDFQTIATGITSSALGGGGIHAASYTATALTKGITYVYRVKAYANNGQGDSPGNTWIVRIPNTPPSTVRYPDADPVSGGAIIRWNAPEDSGGVDDAGEKLDVTYKISYAVGWNVPEGSLSYGPETTPQSGLTYAALGLRKNTDYTFRVVPVNREGAGPANTASVRTDATTPSGFGGLSASMQDRSAYLNWSEPEDNGGLPITYEVYVITTGAIGDGDTSETPSGARPVYPEPGLSCTVRGLATETDYTFIVRAKNDKGSVYARTSGTTLAKIAPDVTSLSALLTTATAANGLSGGAIELLWYKPAPGEDDDPDAYSYEVYIKEGNTADVNGDFDKIADVSKTSATTASAVVSSGLKADTWYTFKVIARSENAASGGKLVTMKNGLASPDLQTPRQPSPARNVSAEAAGAAIDVRWDGSEYSYSKEEPSYRVYRREGKTDSVNPVDYGAEIDDGTKTSYADSITANMKGRTYTYLVVAHNKGGDAAGVTSPAITVPKTAPGAPTNVTAASITSGSAVISWTVPVDKGGYDETVTYDVFVAAAGESPQNVKTKYGDTTILIPNLKRATEYTVTIVARNSAVADASNPRTVPFKTKITAPAPVTALRAFDDGQDIALVWTAPSDDGGGSVSYEVSWCEGNKGAGDDWTGTDVTTKSTTETKYVAEGLNPETLYTFRVRAVSVNVNEEEFSAGEFVQAKIIVLPAQVVTPTPTPQPTEIFITWNRPSNLDDSILLGYEVAVYLTGSGVSTQDAEKPVSTAEISPTTAGIISTTVSGLGKGRMYAAAIVPFRMEDDVRKDGEPFAVDFTTLTTSPGAVQIRNAAASGTGATLSWDAPKDDGGLAVTSYVIYRNASPTFPVSDPVATSAALSLSYTDRAPLEAYTMYWYFVVAENGNGRGAPSAPMSVRTADSVPPAPAGLAATAGIDNIKLTWSASPSVTGYRVNGVDVGHVTAYTLTGLAAGTSYTVRVTAINRDGIEGAAATLTVGTEAQPVTPAPDPPAPAADPVPAAPVYPAVASIRTPITGLSMVVGKSLNLKNMVGVYDAENKPISDPGAKWASSKSDVVAVSASGAVKAGKKPGKAVISLTAQNGRSLKVNITVVKKAKKLKKLTGKVPALKVGKPAYITLKGAGTNITGYKWKVKGSGLKIDKFGMATATKKGKFTITVTAGGKKWVKKVTVK
jgi:hypothetical protein